MISAIVRAVILSALFGWTTGEAALPRRLDIDVRFVPNTDRLDVTMRFKGSANGTSVLRMPGSWAGAEHPERGIVDLAVTTRGARLEETGGADRRRVIHRPGEPIEVRYGIVQIEKGEPSAAWSSPYFPVVRDTYFHLLGSTTWVLPFDIEDPDLPIDVRMRFELPAGAEFASSFGVDATQLRFNGVLGYFQDAVFVGGDWRLRSRDVRGNIVVTATRGNWPFRDSAFADRVASIVGEERLFWRDDGQGRFLVTLLPLHASGKRTSLVGTGLLNSFATFVQEGTALERMDFLFTHEYFHNWNRRALGRTTGDPMLYAWFGEGFTDYYSYKLMLRSGLIELDAFATAIDEVLRSLAIFPERHLPNAAIAARFFTDELGVGKLPYWRGTLLAARWDAEIRAGSRGEHSLDDAMRALRDNARDEKPTPIFDAARIVKTMRRFGVTHAADDIARFIDRGDTIDLADGTLGSCVVVGSIVEARFDVGFDVETTMRTRKVTGVDPAGPAHAAGLRDGQIMRSIDMYRMPDRVATIGIQDGQEDRERRIAFFPAGEPIRRQRVSVPSGLDSAARLGCLAEFGAITPGR